MANFVPRIAAERKNGNLLYLKNQILLPAYKPTPLTNRPPFAAARGRGLVGGGAAVAAVGDPALWMPDVDDASSSSSSMSSNSSSSSRRRHSGSSSSTHSSSSSGSNSRRRRRWGKATGRSSRRRCNVGRCRATMMMMISTTTSTSRHSR